MLKSRILHKIEIHDHELSPFVIAPLLFKTHFGYYQVREIEILMPTKNIFPVL